MRVIEVTRRKWIAYGPGFTDYIFARGHSERAVISLFVERYCKQFDHWHRYKCERME